MPIVTYLAMTSAEFQHCDPLPEAIGWMACHFSPSGAGLSNLPPQLPEGSLLILDDYMPVGDHDPDLVAGQLAEAAQANKCAGILLDLQHPGIAQTARVVKEVCRRAPCPVAVTEHYCQSTNCAVFLSPPLHIPLDIFLTPWQDRDIWLEAATEDVEWRVTEAGCQRWVSPCPAEAFPHPAPGAFSRYRITVKEDHISFLFRRDREDISRMAAEASRIRCLVGLYQQLK